jgi:L-threonylcarbamoyladenylate synthase
VTQVLTVDPLRINAEIIAQAAALIRAGQLVAFPTETVYGLGANAFDSEAVARIFAAKGRPANDPVIVHVARREQLAEITPFVPALAHRLIEAFWPGPLTLVLARGSSIPPNVSAGLPTVAVRMPAHPVALALIAAAARPIAAPSANLFAHTSPTTAAHVLDDLNERIPLILDGGPTLVGLESTILDVSGDSPRLLRPGGLSLDSISRLLPGVAIEVVHRFAETSDEAMPAPGMLLRHYSPRATLRLFEGADKNVRRALVETTRSLVAAGHSVGLLVADEDRPALTDLADLNVPIRLLGSLADLDQVARNLFAMLRDLDSLGLEVILARTFPRTGVGLAIYDRLLRAAEGRVERAGV